MGVPAQKTKVLKKRKEPVPVQEPEEYKEEVPVKPAQNGNGEDKPVLDETKAVSQGKKAMDAAFSFDLNEEEKKRPARNITFDHYDSSDEEDLRNTIGNIPVEWYDDEEHIGYDKEGNKIGKEKKKGEIDNFLDKMEDPDYWRRVYDRQSGKDVVLTDEQVEKIHNITSGKFPTIGYNPYEPMIEFYSSIPNIHPLDGRPPQKSHFVPSKDELRMVAKFEKAIRMGWAKGPKQPKTKKLAFDLWANEEDAMPKTKSQMARLRMHMPAPKMDMPTHAESYNPPEEYLFTQEERERWEEMEEEDRRQDFIPAKFDALRKVPQYDKFIKDRFERCMDLYLAPRQRKLRLNVESASQLLPDLPNPNDLKPFPTTLAFMMHGHVGQVRSVCVEPEKGELLVSGGKDGTVRIWMLDSGRCIKTIKVDGAVTSVAFCPNSQRTLIAVAYEGRKVALINTLCGDRLQVSQTSEFLTSLPIGEFDDDGESVVHWKKYKDRVILTLKADVKKVVWHQKGDYFATVGAIDHASSVVIHQITKAKSQCPFSKKKGIVQSVAFHPSQPHFFVATQRHVRVYDLVKCRLVKKCLTGIHQIAVMAPDNHGDNLFVGGLDRRFAWMDLQLSNKPWKTLRHHTSAIRGVSYHKRYPLLATVSDDGNAIVYYARIHADFVRDNELVPVKKLRAHSTTSDRLNMLDTCWHPTQPWLITAGADGTIALFTY